MYRFTLKGGSLKWANQAIFRPMLMRHVFILNSEILAELISAVILQATAVTF